MRTVQVLCAKLYSGKAEYKRRGEIERQVMSFKEDDAHKQREKEKRRLAYELREGKHIGVLNEYSVSKRFRALCEKESEEEIKVQRKVKRKKVEFLARKKKESEEKRIEHKDDKVSNICKTIDTSDRTIPAHYSREPRVYGGAKVTKEEEAALTLPPKFTIYEKVNKEKALVEIESMTAKYLWQLSKEREEECENDVSKNEVSGGMNDQRTKSAPSIITDTDSDNSLDSNTDESNPDENETEEADAVASRTRSRMSRSQIRRRDMSNNGNVNGDRVNSQQSHTHLRPQPPHSPQPIPNSNTNSNSRTSEQLSHVPDRESDASSKKTYEYEERKYHFDIDKETFDFRNLRPTDLPSNKHIFLPQNQKNRPHEDTEIELAYLNLELQKATDEFISTHKLQSNLTKKELKGLKQLSKREDVVIFQTDKSSRFSVDDKSNYVKANETHVRNDEVIDEQTYSHLQREVNAHSVMWAKFLKAGEHAGDNGPQRVRENMISSDRADPPPLYGLRKDHKKHDDPEVGPPTRPVCGASVAHNGKLSHLISMILKEMKRKDEHACESTEDVMAAIETVNREHSVESDNKMLVGSLDVKALYPSLNIPFAAKTIGDEYVKSNVEFERDSIDVFELGLYLALTVDSDTLAADGLKDYCPTRKNTLGRKPTVTGQAFSSTQKREGVWHYPRRQEPDNETLKKMIGKAVEVGINTVMRTHVYKFAGETRVQKQGGAIGLELTGEIAGVFMSWWDRQMRCKIEEEGIKTVVYKRYVDDINLVVEVKKDVEEDELWKKVKDIGDSIHESIQLEADYPARYDDQKVPILDIKVWIDSEGRIMHEYYSKPVSSKSVIDANSAMPLKDRRTVLTQDLLRVILRCSPDLPWADKKKHIEEYMLRMQFSGYDEAMRKEVLRSAIKAYENIKEKVRKKERPLYRTKEWKQKERMKEKRKRKTNWYQRKKKRTSEEEYKSVLFVQPTKDSMLKRKYEEVIRKSKCSVKVIERAGKSVCQKLHKSYPFKKNKCNTGDCFICLSEGKGNCLRENVNYEILCTRPGCNYQYKGESSRNGYCRGREHLKGLAKRDPESVFVEHVINKHDSDFDTHVCFGFRMNVTDSHTNAMERQITEAIKIETQTKPSLNRKQGFRSNGVLRLRASLTSDDSTPRA